MGEFYFGVSLGKFLIGGFVLKLQQIALFLFCLVPSLGHASTLTFHARINQTIPAELIGNPEQIDSYDIYWQFDTMAVPIEGPRRVTTSKGHQTDLVTYPALRAILVLGDNILESFESKIRIADGIKNGSSSSPISDAFFVSGTIDATSIGHRSNGTSNGFGGNSETFGIGGFRRDINSFSGLDHPSVAELTYLQGEFVRAGGITRQVGNGSVSLLDSRDIVFTQLTELPEFLVNEPAPVPLPAGLPLMLAGLAGFGCLRARRKRS